MSLNGFQESTRVATQLDSMVGKFWNQTAVSRKTTHDLFYLDEMERQNKAKEEQNRKTEQKQCSDGSFQKRCWKMTYDSLDDSEKDDWQDANEPCQKSYPPIVDIFCHRYIG